MNEMYEVEPWPGLLFITSGSTNFEFDVSNGNNHYKKNYAQLNVTKVIYKRINGKIYIGINNNELIEASNHSTITSFDTPVTFGCSLTSNNTPQRYYKGILKNMEIILFE